jgi:sugar phosphate isomerase/epimerase
MYLTGFADEASNDIEGQINATKILGWSNVEARNINNMNIIDLPEKDFKQVVSSFGMANIRVNCVGSTIANWAKHILDDFQITIEEIKRAIPRLNQLGTKMIRIMSYAIINATPDQIEQERFRRLREIKKMFDDAGIITVHENCQNYGGMSYKHTLMLLENIPGLRLVFDTGNPISSDDYSRQKPYPKQSSWEFYSNVKEHISYVHIKDGVWNESMMKMKYTWPGEGRGDIGRILKDLLQRGYNGGISIEPHIAMVFHDRTHKENHDYMFAAYIEYGKKLERLIKNIQLEFGAKYE